MQIGVRIKRALFQSTPSAWRETVPAALVDVSLAFQSTPSAWRETRNGRAFRFPKRISNHSLRMEGDRLE